jgi:hypothetical protein
MIAILGLSSLAIGVTAQQSSFVWGFNDVSLEIIDESTGD